VREKLIKEKENSPKVSEKGDPRRIERNR